MKITQEELLKIAKMSQLSLDKHEVEQFVKGVQDVLTYAECIKDVAHELEDISTKNVNVFREDMVSETDSEVIRSQAPDREQDYFVVPPVIDRS